MANIDAFDQLYNSLTEMKIVSYIHKNGFQSIDDVDIYYKKVKSKLFKFIPIKKKKLVVKFEVKEAEYFTEVLGDSLNIKRIADSYVTEDYDLEIVYL